jgi:hypothetical protein
VKILEEGAGFPVDPGQGLVHWAGISQEWREKTGQKQYYTGRELFKVNKRQKSQISEPLQSQTQ